MNVQHLLSQTNLKPQPGIHFIELWNIQEIYNTQHTMVTLGN